MKRFFILILIIFLLVGCSNKKETKYYLVEFSVEVINSQGRIDTINMGDTLCLSNSKVNVVYSPRMPGNIISLEYRGVKGYDYLLIAENVLKYNLLHGPKVIFVGECPE